MLENNNNLLVVTESGNMGYMIINGKNRTFLFGPFPEAQNEEMIRRKLKLVDEAYNDPVLDTGWVLLCLRSSMLYSFATDPLPEGYLRFSGVSIEHGGGARWVTVASVQEFVEKFVVRKSE